MPSKGLRGVSPEINPVVDDGLIFSRLPGAIRNVDANLDRLLTKMTTGSILPVILSHILHRIPNLLIQ
jgi:hypothetical protein